MIRPTTKKDQPKEYESDELLLKKGRWSLWQEGDSSSLWHQCSKGEEPLDFGSKKKAIVLYPIQWHTHHQSGKKRHSPGFLCNMCRKTPPKSILSVYILHNFDDMAEMTARDSYGPGGWIPGW